MITWDDPQKRVARVSLSAGVKFCYVNVTRWGNLSSWGQIRGTSIAQKLTFGSGFASLKVKIESHSNELQQERQVRVEEQNTFVSDFLFMHVMYVIFYATYASYLTSLGSPLHVNRP